MSCDLLQKVPIATVAAGVGHTVFISRTGQGYWCGEGMGREKLGLDSACLENCCVLKNYRQ